MTIVPAKAGALTSISKARSGVSGLASTVLFVLLTLTWGCSGVVSGKSQTTAAPQTFSISGAISPAVGGNGATVTLSGVASATTTANSSGNYTFTGLANGLYAVTPSHAGYAFAPGTQSVTVNGANVTGINFTATAQQTFSISGTISPLTGGAGATVTLSGAAAAMTTSNGAGAYSFAGLANGSYTVTPTSQGFGYTPTSQNVTVSAANITGVNFTATPQATHTVALTWTASASTTVTGYNVYRSPVSGIGLVYAKMNTTPIQGLAYTDLTVQNSVTYSYVATAVDASGNESIFSSPVSAVIP